MVDLSSSPSSGVSGLAARESNSPPPSQDTNTAYAWLNEGLHSSSQNPLRATEAFISGGVPGARRFINETGLNGILGTKDMAARLASLIDPSSAMGDSKLGVVKADLEGYSNIVSALGLGRDRWAPNWRGTPDSVESALNIASNHLQSHGSVLLPAYASGHAIYMKVSKAGDGTYSVTLYNSGEGLEDWHKPDPFGNGRYSTSWKVDGIKEEQISSLMKVTLEETAEVSPLKDTSSFYRRISALSPEWGGGNHGKSENDGVYQRPQKGPNCVSEGVFAYLRNNLNYRDYKGLKGDYLAEVARLWGRARLADGSYKFFEGVDPIYVPKSEGDEIVQEYERRAASADGRRELILAHEMDIPGRLRDSLRNVMRITDDLEIRLERDSRGVFKVFFKRKDSFPDFVVKAMRYHLMSSGKSIISGVFVQEDGDFDAALKNMPDGSYLINKASFLNSPEESRRIEIDDDAEKIRGLPPAIREVLEKAARGDVKISLDLSDSKHPTASVREGPGAQAALKLLQDSGLFLPGLVFIDKPGSFDYFLKSNRLLVDEERMKAASPAPTRPTVTRDANPSPRPSALPTGDDTSPANSTTQTVPPSQVASDLSNQLNSDALNDLGDDAARFGVQTDGPPVEVLTSTQEVKSEDGSTVTLSETRYNQTQPDGSTRTLTRTELSGGGVQWRSEDVSADGNSLSEVSRVKGSDTRSERTAVKQPDGSLKETLVEYADSQLRQSNPDAAVVRTESTTRDNPDGSRQVVEDKWTADTLQNASAQGYPSKTEHHESTITQEVGTDGIQRTREASTKTSNQSGQLSRFMSEEVTVHHESGDVVESVVSEVSTPTDETVRLESKAGQIIESFKGADGQWVLADGAVNVPAGVNQALDAVNLAHTQHLAGVASKEGIQSVASLLPAAGEGSDEAVTKALQERAATSIKRVNASRAFAAGGHALAVYGGVMGALALRDGIRSGDAYALTLGATGVSAAAAEVGALGVRGASLVASSTRAIQVLGKVGNVAGKLAIGLGAATMAVSVYGLVEAIKKSDTKAIVGNAVGIGGGVAALVAGAAFGGPIGLGAAFLLGGLTIGITEAVNKLFNPGTPISGADPLAAMDTAQRTAVLENAQTLFAQWDKLGGSLSKDRFKELSESGPTDEIKAAAKFFVEHEDLINWIDAANGGGADLEKRNAHYDGQISQSDLSRFIGHVAIPRKTYETLPPPSMDARLWVVGVMDTTTHKWVVDFFGKDGKVQGRGDSVAGLGEYANIASGLFDSRVTRLIKTQHPDETDEQIAQRLSNLKLACAYLTAYPSELRALDSANRPGQEDGRVGQPDLDALRKQYQADIDKVMAAYPDGPPSFNAQAANNVALVSNNPAVWRPGRFDEPNPSRPQSYHQVVLEQFDAINTDGDGELKWDEMANAREQALQQKQYGLYFSLDYIMRKGADVFTDRGEGMGLHLSKADLAAKVGQDIVSAADAQLVLPISLANRAIEAATLAEFIADNPKSAGLSMDDVQALSAGQYTDQNGQQISVTEVVRQAALYFTQNPTELAAITTHGKNLLSGASEFYVGLNSLQTAAAGQAAATEPIPVAAEEASGAQASPSHYGAGGPNAEQQQQFWAFLDQHFDEIAVGLGQSAPASALDANGHLLLEHLGEFHLKDAQQKYLEQGNWEGYYAVGWVLSHYTEHSDGINNLSKDTVRAQAAQSLLNSERNQIDEADGSKDGKLSLEGLEKVRAQHEQKGQTQQASYTAWLIEDYRARTQGLVNSLDVDVGMKEDNKPADQLISIQGDIGHRLQSGELSAGDHQAAQSLQDNIGQIAHYGDEGDIVSNQDVAWLLEHNLQWLDGARNAPAPAPSPAPAPAPSPASVSALEPSDEGADVMIGS